MIKNTLTPVVAFIVIGAGGFWAGRFSSPGSPSDTAEQLTGASSGRAGRELSGRADATQERGTRRQARAGRGTSEETMARLTSIMRNEDPLDRNRALFAFIDRLGPADFKSAVEHFRSLGLTDSRMGEYALLLSAWAKMDPLAVLDFAKSIPDGEFAADTALATWASRDAGAALLWAKSNHEGPGTNPYLVGVIRGIAETDPESATALLTDMGPGSERDEALKGILPQLLAQGVEATKTWIAGLPDEALRISAMKRCADDLAAIDPAGTAEWLIANPSEATERRMGDVYSKWALQDPKAAVDAVENLPAGNDRSNALRGVVSAMASSDPKAALAVIERFPDDANERVMKGFLWSSLNSDPGLAISQVSSIEDEGSRNWWYGRTLESWIDRDADAANAWIQTNPLPQPVLDKLANRLGNQP